MKTLRIFSIIVLALALVACVKENDVNVEPAKERTLHFTATIAAPAATKTTYDEDGTTINVVWKTGDKIALVHNNVKDIATVTAVDESGKATIEADITGSPSDNDDVVLAYPADAVAAAVPVGTFPFTPSPSCWNKVKGQDGTLDYIQNNIDFRLGNGKLSVNGDDASLKESVSMPSFISIWKISLQNESSNPFNTFSISVSVAEQVQAAASSATPKSTFYLCVVPALFPSGKLTIDTTWKGIRYIYTKVGGVTLTAGKYYQSTVTMTNVDAPLPGVFSVSEGQTVKFSKGNLQATYNGSSWSWAFAANQWDYIGNAAGNTSINGNGTLSSAGTVDLFGWVGMSSTVLTGDIAKYGISNSTTASDYSTDAGERLKSDWGVAVNAVYLGGYNDWRTLTGQNSGEWKYLLETRSASTVNGTTNARFCKATVNSVPGLVIFADTYTHPIGVTAPKNINFPPAAFTGNSWSGDDWTAMEMAGCVFLPAAGYRSGATVNDAGTEGWYWSNSTHASDAGWAGRLYFWSGDVNGWANKNVERGFSVRLVRNAN